MIPGIVVWGKVGGGGQGVGEAGGAAGGGAGFKFAWEASCPHPGPGEAVGERP